MKTDEFIQFYSETGIARDLMDHLSSGQLQGTWLSGMAGSSVAALSAAVTSGLKGTHLFILNEKEQAAYFFNDLESLFGEKDASFVRKRVHFFPTSYKKSYDLAHTDSTNALERSQVVGKLSSQSSTRIVVTFPEALAEKLVTRSFLSKSTFRTKLDEELDMDELIDFLDEQHFVREDFVIGPGQYAVRGGIVDVFSYSDDFPYRIEFRGDKVASLRSFDPENQLSVDKLSRISIIPDLNDRRIDHRRENLQALLPEDAVIWVEDITFTRERINEEFKKAARIFKERGDLPEDGEVGDMFLNGEEWQAGLYDFSLVTFSRRSPGDDFLKLEADIAPQPSFNKNFDLLSANLKELNALGYTSLILSSNPRQLERLHTIFEDISFREKDMQKPAFDTMGISLYEGFIDRQAKISVYTDHQIFERYHKFRLRESFTKKETLSIRELHDLKQGDFVTHIDHGVGRFDGLEKIMNNGKEQEAIRLVYKNNDLLYVSIHSLHRIAKFTGKEGTIPKLNKLGSSAWNTLKNKTKSKVKDIARDLIRLYARRKASEGFAFTPDTYLQTELEASFFYEDTPDQIKATRDVKKDMEATYPMDRLICGDVGFGKTEVAIRAAFKAVADSKQVALLVPTTILALQHYKTFSDRLKDMPVNIDYINRFKSTKKQKETIRKLAEGEIDVLIGTHRLISKDLKFKDLGLLIIDEEQKFGVTAKERLKEMSVGVDTLTLTATPIPRTLQFSMMGARDLSIINTPPANRYPVQTELRSFSEDTIRDAITYEISRGGQVFFVHNRVQNIMDVDHMLRRFLPNVKIAVAHGQMEGRELERRMLDFIEGDYDILLATTIIESGLDIPNVNTIIINDAHQFGLSDLHQLRGRVGRTNKKAFCYLLTPPLSGLTREARQRLRAIEEFAELGSGFNIAMRDLDIRGAGNLLGAEQSGFISEIGFEMYHRILDEAIQELKSKEFNELYEKEEQERFVSDCQIETDLELLIPDDYITNIKERLSLYKELDSIEDEDGLMGFQEKLIDRFGPLPQQVAGLMNAIRLRWLAREAGFEKVVLLNKRMTGYFIQDQESAYYQSEIFTRILRFVQANPKRCRMKEARERLTLTFMNVNTVFDGLELLKLLQSTIPVTGDR
ncbi:MAG: transcription-repair coupling factor [Bacteroidales bacterium]|jgi:transcription-repair coupling factor (superfamily II helicase)|nr:transcription-repair coupling factor [Bacteroidales bacterium]